MSDLFTFKVISERNCPYYNIDDWFILNNKSLKVPGGLPSCLILVRELTGILFSLMSGPDPDVTGTGNILTCGGCTGLIKFVQEEMPSEVKKRGEYSGDRKEVPGGAVSPATRQNDGVIVSGSLAEISPSELLQFFHMHQKTGKLGLDVPGGSAGVVFREGEMIGARYGEKKDKEAIFLILGECRGSFNFVSGLPDSYAEAAGLGDFMMVLMECLKRLDEAATEGK